MASYPIDQLEQRAAPVIVQQILELEGFTSPDPVYPMEAIQARWIKASFMPSRDRDAIAALWLTQVLGITDEQIVQIRDQRENPYLVHHRQITTVGSLVEANISKNPDYDPSEKRLEVIRTFWEGVGSIAPDMLTDSQIGILVKGDSGLHGALGFRMLLWFDQVNPNQWELLHRVVDSWKDEVNYQRTAS